MVEESVEDLIELLTICTKEASTSIEKECLKVALMHAQELKQALRIKGR